MGAANRIPVKTVRVLGKTYRITDNAKATKALDFDPVKDNGIHDSTKCRILVANIPVGAKRQVMLHELMHAIEDAGSIKISHDDIDRVASILNAIFQDNPELARWLIGQ